MTTLKSQHLRILQGAKDRGVPVQWGDMAQSDQQQACMVNACIHKVPWLYSEKNTGGESLVTLDRETLKALIHGAGYHTANYPDDDYTRRTQKAIDEAEALLKEAP